jgi:hypothetical protein
MRRALGPLAAGLAVGVWTAAFRHYGVFDAADEGTLLAQALRVAHGQVPYVDFDTGYGPLYFLLQGQLVAAAGLGGVRWGLIATHAATGALLYALARRVVGSALAAVAVVLEIAFFLPVAPGKGAPFNVPYPAWYAGLAGVAMPLLLDASPGRRGAWDACFAGMIAGLVFAMKPNSGGLLVMGAAAAVVLAGGRPGGAGPLGWFTLGLAVLGAGVLAAPAGGGLTYAVLVPPVVALAALGFVRGAPEGEVLRRLAALGAGFALVAGMLLAPPFVVLGARRFSREVLLVGAGVAQVYALPFPWPTAVAVIAGLLAFFLPSRRGITIGVGVLAVVLGFADGARGAPGLAAAVRCGAEETALVLVPLVVWGALAALRRPRHERLVAPAALATTAALQLYPRVDVIHLMPVAPLLLPLALRLWRALVARLALRPRAAAAVVVGLPLAVAVGRLAPGAWLAADVARGRVVAVALGDERLVISPAGAASFEALGETVDAVRRASTPHDPLLGFPACGLVAFFARRLPAGRVDYFFPGRPTRGEAAVRALELGAERPPLAVTCAAAGTDLAAAWEYYPEMVGLLASRYRVRLERPPYTLWEADPKHVSGRGRSESAASVEVGGRRAAAGGPRAADVPERVR